MRTSVSRLCIAALLAVAILAGPLSVGGASAGRDKQAPTAPAGLTSSSVTQTSVALTWTASTDNVAVASYSIYKNGTLVGTSTTNAYTATALIPGTQYSFYVKAKDPTGNSSAASNTCTVTTLPGTPPPAMPYRVVAYYTSWSAYRGYTPDKIPYDKVSYVNYAFANIGSDLKIALGDATIDITNFAKLRDLKKFNPDLKVLISVGGWSWSGKFSDVALTDASRTVFAQSCVAFIKQYGLDGVDLDWEYPVAGGMSTNTTRPEDKQNFTLLLQKLRALLDAENAGYVLTIAAGVTQSYVNNTEPAKILASVDFLNLMTYDIHGAWDRYTDFNGPLYPDSLSPQARWSIDDGVKLWVAAAGSSQGAAKSKLVVGIPFYGKAYGAVKSTDSSYPGLYGLYGKCTTVTYKEIVTGYLSNTAYTRYFHTTAKVPYLFNGATFVSYDDEESIAAKTAYIKAGALGGAMVWELSQDYEGRLIGAVYDRLK